MSLFTLAVHGTGKRFRLHCVAGFWASILFSSAVPAHDGHKAAPASPKERAAQIFFSDRPLVTQHGQHVRFFSDVLKDKVVLVSFLFTECADSCPLQAQKMAAVQSLLAGWTTNVVRLVSISVDPDRDQPEVLREYASRFRAGPGWFFLTGKKTDIDDVIRRLGHAAPAREAHTSLFLLGNSRTGKWLKLDPDTAAVEIAERLRELAADAS